jgi:phosphoribosylanthranilate isomerase
MSEKAPVKVKICGVTNAPDAELAVQLGAWAVGMIFYDASPRRCAREEALQIAAAVHRKVMLCGVYVNAPLEQIEHDSEELGLGAVQLHGDEGPAFCSELRRRAGVRIIKARQVVGAGDIRDIGRYRVDYHLLDAKARGARRELRGGTGETFDWELIATRRSKVPLIVSGGLSAENVGDAIAATHPYAVDSASGTEAAPGHKDPARMRDLFDAVARAGAEPARIAQPAAAPARS